MQNATFCHFRTDASYFYFDRPIQLDGGDGLYAYNGDFWVRTDPTAPSGGGTPVERLTIKGAQAATAIGIANTSPQTELDVTGTIRASSLASAGAILGADGNGDIGAGGLTIRDEGSPLGNPNSVTSFNFVGAGVVASRASATDSLVTVTVAGGGGGGVTTALLTTTSAATCAQAGATITTTGDARQIAYVNGDPGAAIIITNPTADGVRLTITSLTGFGSGAPSRIDTLVPMISPMSGLVTIGVLEAFSVVELIYKSSGIGNPDDPGAPTGVGWVVASAENLRTFSGAGFVV